MHMLECTQDDDNRYDVWKVMYQIDFPPSVLHCNTSTRSSITISEGFGPGVESFK